MKQILMAGDGEVLFRSCKSRSCNGDGGMFLLVHQDCFENIQGDGSKNYVVWEGKRRLKWEEEELSSMCYWLYRST